MKSHFTSRPLPLSLVGLWLCALLLSVSSCSQDEAPAAAYTQGLGDLRTDAAGRGISLRLDGADDWAVVTNPPAGLRADTTCRVLAFYVRQGAQLRLADYVPVLVAAVGRYPASLMITDPLTPVACWRIGDYINLRLAIKGSVNKAHALGFAQTDYIRHADGSRTLCAVLLHHQNGDPPYYTREAYLSLPLRQLDGLLAAGRDTVSLTIETFAGRTVYAFPF